MRRAFTSSGFPKRRMSRGCTLSPDTRRILVGMGHTFSEPQPDNHVAAILIGAPALRGQPIGKNRFYGAIDPRQRTGLALGY